MVRLIFTIIFSSLLVTTKATPVVHPFYVSVTEMNYNAKNKSLEISCKMFAEDIESILKRKYNSSVSLTNDKQLQQNNKLLSEYMLQHLFINVDAKKTLIKYVGFEKENESIYCYFEVEALPSLKRVDIKNSILQDYKEEQINIIHVIVSGNRKSSKSDAANPQVSFSF